MCYDIFGSSANDAAFNAYITDITDDGNRGKVEGVLAILPLVSMLVIIGGFSWMTDKGMWLPFYLIFGGLTIVVGIVALFVMPKDVVEPNKEANYLANLIYGFKPNVIKIIRNYMLVLLVFSFIRWPFKYSSHI